MTSRRSRSTEKVAERRKKSPSPYCTRYAGSLRKLHPSPILAAAALTAVVAGCGLVGCDKSPATIVVGSQSSTGQIITGEIVAQHLERRLGRAVERRLGIGSGMIVYQELQLQHISLYPVFTGALESEVLKERANSSPTVVWQRTHEELSRVAKMELFNPLGYENPPAMVVQTANAAGLTPPTLSQAAAVSTKWKIGVSYEFLQNSDSVTAIKSYHLPIAKSMRGMELTELFPALEEGAVTMIATDAIDGRIMSADYRVLADDRHAFPPYQACLLTRQDVLAAEPRLSGYLAELSGKFTTEGMRKMSAEVDLDHIEPAVVAAEFLAQAGLK
jgi:osmoprotectant transport system substrate-binding protein